MPLDPKAKVFLDQWNAAIAAADPPSPPLDQIPVGDLRNMFKGLLLQWEGPTQPVAGAENRAIPGPGGDLPVRIYTPEGTGPFGILIYFYGSGWVVCDLDTHDGVCRALANGAGCVVVAVDYRKAPEHRFPAAIEDCYAATAWAFEHAGELAGDPTRIAVGGDSAGGTLATGVALMAQERGGPPLVHQLLVYPATDCSCDTASHHELADGYLITRDMLLYFWKQYLGEDGDGSSPYASPLRAPDLAALPPALVITAEYDPLRDEGEASRPRLRAAGVAVTLSRYDGVPHIFWMMPTVLDQAQMARTEAAAALRAAFAGR